MLFGLIMPKRDAAAFEQLCAPYSGMVYRHCLHMLKHPQDAEDAAQESMLRAFRAFSSFHGSGVATWLYRIAHNTCLDVLKSAHHRRESLLPEDFDAPDASPTPEDAYMQSDESQRLWQLVQELPLPQQTVLSLYYGENMSYDAIARATGMLPGTVKSRLSRAKEALKEKLSENGNQTDPSVVCSK